MLSPIGHIGAFAIEDVAEWGMAVIAGSAEHGEVPIDLSWEHNTVPVEGQEGVFQLIELFKVICICHSNGWTMISVTPCYIITVINLANPWI